MGRPIRRLLTAIVAASLLSAVFAASAMATTTGPAEDVTATNATLPGSFCACNERVHYAFQYGTTTEYGSNTPVQEIEGKSGTFNVSAHVEHLNTGTTYHYRLVVLYVGGGYSIGKDMTFTTLWGLYLKGEKSETEANQPQIASSFGLVGLGGEVAPGATWNLLEEGECSTITSWPGTLSSPSVVSFPLEGAKCSLLGEPATVTSNGCGYVFRLANSGPPYTGSAEIACPKGKAIEISNWVCTVRIPAQAPGGGAVSFSETSHNDNEEGGTELIGAIAIQASGSEKIEKVSGPYCFALGNEGTFGGRLVLFQ